MPRQSIDIEGFGHENPIPAATRIGPLLVSSIIAPFDAGTRDVPADPEAQVRNLFASMAGILAAAGGGFADVAKITFFVNDLVGRGHQILLHARAPRTAPAAPHRREHGTRAPAPAENGRKP